MRSAFGPSGSSHKRQRHADGLATGTEQCDGAVDAAAHRDGRPADLRLGAKHRRECVRERIRREHVTADRGCLEQCQAHEVAVEPGRVRLDDAVAVDAEAHRRPLAVARGVSEALDHDHTVVDGKSRRGLSAPPKISTLPFCTSYVNLANQVGPRLR